MQETQLCDPLTGQNNSPPPKGYEKTKVIHSFTLAALPHLSKQQHFKEHGQHFFSYPVLIQHFRKLFVCFQMLKEMHKIIQMLLSPQMGLKTTIHYFRSPLSNRNSLISTLNNTGSAFVTCLSELGPEHFSL